MNPQERLQELTLMAGTRDASWYARPRHDHGRESTWAPVYHVQDAEFDGTPACNPNRALLEEPLTPAADVPAGARCRRPACKVRWP